MSNGNIYRYGSEKPLPEQIHIQAGPVDLVFEEGDLRTLRVNGMEIVRRIYVAVRDRNWGTVGNRLSNVVINRQADHFQINFEVTNQLSEIDFRWRGEIVGHADGTVIYRMAGEARTTFLRNRIGFCVLHPAALAGTKCRVEQDDSIVLSGFLPDDINPDQPVLPFTDMRALSYPAGSGLDADLQFEGDIFEMEDQRNWTDASFKTFCTPLRLPYPVEVKAGAVVQQSVTLRLKPGSRNGVKVQPVQKADTIREDLIDLAADWEGKGFPMPGLGFGMSSDGQELTDEEIERMRVLKPHHIRVDLRLGSEGWEERLRLACREAKSLATRLVPALFVPEIAEAELKRLAQLQFELVPDILAWLVYPQKESFLGGSPTAQAVEQFRSVFPDAKMGAGTNTDLIFLKRNVPPLELIDLVTFAINPQVHAFDNLSLVETLEAQPMAVESARRLSRGLPVAVSAVTFKPRWNPYATAAPTPVPAGELPQEVDPRQLSSFGAGWTLGSIAAMARGGAAWVTYYETAGWRGLMEQASGSRAPLQFPSEPGKAFPLYWVFHALADFVGGEVLPVRMDDSLKVSALAVRKEGKQVLLLANLNEKATNVRVNGRGYALSAFEFKVLRG